MLTYGANGSASTGGWLEHTSVGDRVEAARTSAFRSISLMPFDDTSIDGYYDWPASIEVMPINVTGIVTARDDFVIDLDRDALRSRIGDLRSKRLSDDAIRRKYFVGKGSKKYPPGDSRGWKLPLRPAGRFERTQVGRALHARAVPAVRHPGDVLRPVDGGLASRPRPCRICWAENVGLIFMRAGRDGRYLLTLRRESPIR